MNWPCTLCGSRHWPDPDSSCALCNDGSKNPDERGEGTVTAKEKAIRRFALEGCHQDSASLWWAKIDKLTDEDLMPDIMSDRLSWLHEDACRRACDFLEPEPSPSAWADVCAIAGFDICKIHTKQQQMK
tara:strand:+ start:698 stop:1084 length:387 start_codon:yes stop_codon:yes gene_type:complete